MLGKIEELAIYGTPLVLAAYIFLHMFRFV